MIKDAYAASEIIDGKNGFLCNENAADLARCIMEALNNPKLKNIAENAKKSLYITWEQNLEQVLECYKQIINNK